MLTQSRSIDSMRSPGRRGLTHEVISIEHEDTALDPEKHAVFASRRERVHAALSALPKSQREAIELAFFRGLSQSEIAQRTGAPLGTIKWRVREGMTRLRSLLADFESDYVN
jgi:RNA polymerase sigma-70 factor (ECF subfamily)